MIFSLLVIILVFGVAYFHWVQGLLNGIISAVLAMAGAALALGYAESVVASLLGGKVADSANGLMMCAIFAGVYLGGRILFDSMIPANVRLPLYFDRIGGAVCGVVAGTFAVGTLAIAAQSMPFGPTIGGFSRYALAEPKEVRVPGPGSGREVDAMVQNALEDDYADPAKQTNLLYGADSMVVDFVTFQSRDGALAGATPFEARHPNLLREIFLARVGIEPAAKHSALNIAAKPQVSVAGVYAPAALTQVDAELPTIRSRNLPKQVKADPKGSKAYLVVRAVVDRQATDQDSKFRFSPGGVRLVADGKDYHPVGTLYHVGGNAILMANRIDDYLLGEMPQGTNDITIDFVFEVERADALTEGGAASPDGKTAATGAKVKPGVFLEVKRYARVDLTDKEIAPTVAPAPAPTASGTVARKETLLKLIAEQASKVE